MIHRPPFRPSFTITSTQALDGGWIANIQEFPGYQGRGATEREAMVSAHAMATGLAAEIFQHRVRAMAARLYRQETLARQRATKGAWLSAPYEKHVDLAKECLNAANAYWNAEASFHTRPDPE
jgi:predicted RNase H-like HicB family nuclease